MIRKPTGLKKNRSRLRTSRKNPSRLSSVARACRRWNLIKSLLAAALRKQNIKDLRILTCKKTNTRWFKSCPFHPLVGGHLTPWKGHLTIPKRSLWITRHGYQNWWFFENVSPLKYGYLDIHVSFQGRKQLQKRWICQGPFWVFYPWPFQGLLVTFIWLMKKGHLEEAGRRTFSPKVPWFSHVVLSEKQKQWFWRNTHATKNIIRIRSMIFWKCG